MLLEVGPRLGVLALDVRLQDSLLNPPLPPTAELDSRKVTATNQGIRLSATHTEQVCDIFERQEPGFHAPNDA